MARFGLGGFHKDGNCFCVQVHKRFDRFLVLSLDSCKLFLTVFQPCRPGVPLTRLVTLQLFSDAACLLSCSVSARKLVSHFGLTGAILGQF